MLRIALTLEKLRQKNYIKASLGHTVPETLLRINKKQKPKRFGLKA